MSQGSASTAAANFFLGVLKSSQHFLLAHLHRNTTGDTEKLSDSAQEERLEALQLEKVLPKHLTAFNISQSHSRYTGLMKTARDVIVQMEQGAKHSLKAVCDRLYDQAKNLEKTEKLEEEKEKLGKELESLKRLQ
jgi:hypothetical protein